MASLIGAGITSLARTQLARFRVHSFTLTPRTAGAVDGENNATSTPGSPVTGVACKYVAEDRVLIQATGQTLVSVPTLTVAHDLSVAAGSQASNVQDSDGVVIFVGPATVEYIVPAAGLGPTLKKKLVLRGADVR
jgi:hypothetical protein